MVERDNFLLVDHFALYAIEYAYEFEEGQMLFYWELVSAVDHGGPQELLLLIVEHIYICPYTIDHDIAELSEC